MYLVEIGDDGKETSPVSHNIDSGTEIPPCGYANPQDLEPRRDIIDGLVARGESGIRIIGMLGNYAANFAAHRAVNGLEIISDKLRRE